MMDMLYRFPRRLRAAYRLVAAAALVAGALLSRPAPGLAQSQWRLDDWQRTYPPNTAYGEWSSNKFAPLFGSGDLYFYQFVHDSADAHYLHVQSGRNNSFSVGLRKKFRLQDWPVLSWEWRVTVLPEGGDVRVKERDDQAGAMCVIVNPGLIGFESVCYLWENGGPIDSPLIGTKKESARYLILRTAQRDGSGSWTAERRNILEDYRRLFGKDPVEEAVIGVQIDSNDTQTRGEAYYRNIVLHKG